MKENSITTQGKVVRVESYDFYKVLINNTTHQILAKRNGKMVKYRINVSLGDNVEIEMSQYDLGKGRITRRL